MKSNRRELLKYLSSFSLGAVATRCGGGNIKTQTAGTSNTSLSMPLSATPVGAQEQQTTLPFYDGDENGRIVTTPILSTIQLGPVPIQDKTTAILFGQAWQAGLYHAASPNIAVRMTDLNGTISHHIIGPSLLGEIWQFHADLLFFQTSRGLCYRVTSEGYTNTLWSDPSQPIQEIDGDGPEDNSKPILIQMQLVYPDGTLMEPPPESQITFGCLCGRTF